ncbi:restriction endonuclease subunit S [Corynebacterium sp. CCUG 65737]|uniref:restriction endonuclease subunit S n=1 Tax=Corynebacterium sp. CCUG 65737 TaxID=2823889 RepID=UPI00210CE0F5|nr:restriction endonuclease subunit S [Corynebacterium sp. CCUG 65737]MCQ4627857.1 restriction endonuclease subunit S [Corynebacterium sp. CCUG 65737]
MELLRLKDIGEIYDGPHATPKRISTGDLHFLNISGLQNGRLDLSTADRISPSDFETWTRRVQPRRDDLLFSYETRIGEAALMPEGISAALGRRMALLRPDNNMVNPRYLLYFWLSPRWQAFLQERTLYGATVNRIPIGDMPNWPIALPPLTEQVKVSGVLGSIDDKIAANTRAINSSTALAAKIVERGMQSNNVRLGDVARITMGTSPKGEYLKEEVGGLPFYQGVRDFGELTPQKRVFTENPVREAETGDILFAVRAPVGAVNVASEPTAIGRGLAAIRGSANHVALFYFLRAHPEIWNTHQDNGTVFASINNTDLSNAPIPEIEMDQSQLNLLTGLHNQALVLTKQNLILAKTRDELLPHLMSGKITVKEAQQVTAAGVDIASEENEA